MSETRYPVKVGSITLSLTAEDIKKAIATFSNFLIEKNQEELRKARKSLVKESA